MIAEHMSCIKQSASSVVSARATELKQQGKDVISLSAGEPDFPTPQHVQLAGIRAIVEGKTKYPPIPGIMPLREAVCRKLARENALAYTPDQVIAGAGAKQVIFNALAVTLNPGDEVIVPAPYFGCYVEETALCKGVPVVVETTQEEGFRLDPQRLEAAITPRTKWLILNNPNNPSGAVLGLGHLKGIAEVLRRHPQVWVLSDDIYEHLIFDGKAFHSILEAAPDLKDRTLVVNGFSKTFCMTGWRLGYGAGPQLLIKNMTKYQSQATSGANQVAQWAGVAALDGDMGFAVRQRAIFQERRDLVMKLIGQVPGLKAEKPEGAFYVYVSCAGLIGKKTPDGAVLSTDPEVATYLLYEGVAMVPGEAFGLSPFFRVSFATDAKTLEEACRRIAAACAKLK
ncbi:pyridoxal phosphate-dependent aminotransferase [Oleispirillum naphthae]|uniref:pyridoxal phosphate-dependent aminotransferase n=1 Tax=Oleispirillum naphthae TaxID=2838853 RepID=UPI0030824D81